MKQDANTKRCTVATLPIVRGHGGDKQEILCQCALNIWCRSKIGTQNRTLVNGNMDKQFAVPWWFKKVLPLVGFIWTHAHI